MNPKDKVQLYRRLLRRARAAKRDRINTAGNNRLWMLVDKALDATADALVEATRELKRYGHGDYPNELADLVNQLESAHATLDHAADFAEEL